MTSDVELRRSATLISCSFFFIDLNGTSKLQYLNVCSGSDKAIAFQSSSTLVLRLKGEQITQT